MTASYAGREISAAIKVVAPEDLPVSALMIVPRESEQDPCALGFVEGSSQDFVVTNPYVIADHTNTGLTYHWDVTNASAQNAAAHVLTIASLPPAGTKVTIKVAVRNDDGIHSQGSYEFTTVAQRTGLKEELRKLNCRLEHLQEINVQIPPNVPVELVTIRQDLEPLEVIEAQALQLVAAAELLISSVHQTQRLAASSRSETTRERAETAKQSRGLTPTGRSL